MKLNRDKVVDLFSYHPPVTESRKQKHQGVNDAIVQCAIALAECVETEEYFAELIDSLQVVRMKANQFITYEEEGINGKSLS